jgi:predicted HAD superfamily Cof-like phosphohydrolase
MNENQKRVKQWMQDFGQETPDKPGAPSDAVRLLRAKLIFEEAMETIDALGVEVLHDEYPVRFRNCDFLVTDDANLVAVADGLADLEVVNTGTAIACGIDLQPCFDEVMRSNDSKAWSGKEVAYNLPPGAIHNINFSGNYIVKRLPDLKVLKSPSYSPANLAPILEAQSQARGDYGNQD